MTNFRALATVALLFCSGCGTLTPGYSGTKNWRTEECESLRGQEQDRCYAAASQTEEEYKRERAENVKDEMPIESPP